MSLADEQRPIDEEICYGACDSAPSEDWEDIRIQVRRTAGGMRISVTSPTPPKTAMPDTSLEIALRKLFLLHDRYKTGLRGAVYNVHWLPDEIKFEAEYEYDDDKKN